MSRIIHSYFILIGASRHHDDEGLCVHDCEKGYWRYNGTRTSRRALEKQTPSDAQGWFCQLPRVISDGSVDTEDELLDADCRREDDFCIPCDPSCGDLGCTGPGAAHCANCKVARLFTDDEQTKVGYCFFNGGL